MQWTAKIAEKQKKQRMISETLGINSNLTHYRIVSKLGAGGMGEVWLAEDTRLDRKVAIKVLPPEVSADEQARKRLVREAQAARPNSIIRISARFTRSVRSTA